MGTDRLSESGYFRAKIAQEKLIKESSIPYSIVHATQFFEFLKGLADISMVGRWGEPYATHYVIQYWTGDDPIKSPTHGVWETFQQGIVRNGTGGTETVRLVAVPVSISVRFVRLWMTESSNTCDAGGPADPRI